MVDGAVPDSYQYVTYLRTPGAYLSHIAIVIRMVCTFADDSGRWGVGGVFSALSTRSAEPQVKYELAGKMMDLSLGDAHILPIDDRMSRQQGNDLVGRCV